MTEINPQSDIERIIAACRKLSMNAMCESLADTLKDAAAGNLTHAAVLARLLETELESRSMAWRICIVYSSSLGGFYSVRQVYFS